jgi:hypothetical protein
MPPVCRAAVVEAARAAVKGAETQVEGARQEQERCTSALRSARVELEKRIHEYDTCVAEHKPEDLVKVGRGGEWGVGGGRASRGAAWCWVA